MQGLELSQKFYEVWGKPMLTEQFSRILPYLAVGLVGSGSECYGYDDAISRDHDFEPGFCIFLPGENIIDRKTAFELERAYGKRPKEFMGISRQAVSKGGSGGHGVIRTTDFYTSKTGSGDGNLSVDQWFSIPEFSLSEAVNGAVFCDYYGEFTGIREKLRIYPEPIRLKKLAGHLLLMGQSGQYNYDRCMKRGEKASAQLALFEFVKNTMHVIFLISKQYLPYYKWSFRALRELLVKDEEIPASLEFLLSSDNSDTTSLRKRETVESVCRWVANMLKEHQLMNSSCNEMEQQAYRVNEIIKDANIRNMHILCGV